ncbi:MAG TPA: class I SAM-dependent methyltransferase [Solirubrobacteraceae bacterium]|nr:class I SAM-dependent methyltransferase [Solirubrobacteraceae bacterium]
MPSFVALRDEILELAMLRPDDRVLDIGAGTGLLALAAAPRIAHVTALDISPPMCLRLDHNRRRLGLANVDTVVSSAAELPMADCTFDAVISNYCFHHLSEAEKHRALGEILRVLRPGGRVVIADMMFRLRVADPRDRAVLALLARRLLKKGFSGLLRLAKNALRVLAGRWEHPAGVDWWREALLAAGFDAVRVRPLEHEGGIADARRADRETPQRA